MSSHREAPGISKDPVADNTDTYAFVSDGNTVTLITSYIPVEAPAGGPNFYEFGDDVRYEIHVDNDGDGKPNVTYRFEFTTVNTNPNTFLYNTGPITALDSNTWNRRQTYTVKKIVRRPGRRPRVIPLGEGLASPPCNVGLRSTPDYASLAASAVQTLAGGELAFAGQRAESFYVDLGSVFDLGTLRPFQGAHLIRTAAADGVDSLAQVNVHTIAIQVPIADVTRDGSVPTDPLSPNAVIGVWGAAYRQEGLLRGPGGGPSGEFVQVSRLGNPLFNEVIVPIPEKDRWNAVGPDQDKDFAKYVARPELAALLPVLYPDVFENLRAYDKDRVDLLAILLTGIPRDVIDGFQNFTGTTQADELRLNVAIPPSANPHRLGLIGGDLAGFPNGRRVGDDVVTIELRAVAGATIPLVDGTFTPDAAADPLNGIEDGTFPPVRDFLDVFPYLGVPYSGYDVPAA
ncbi:MAG TPA: DUF4331 domain-containing protein [Acidimicrobiales bacterium]|nr:DUF4331 domain-containing protein [Acidimicrobiales bacterium]